MDLSPEIRIFLRWVFGFLAVIGGTLGDSDGTTVGPHFRVEPPLRLDFSNSTRSVLDCVADGNPSPSVSWISQDGSPVRSVPGLRHIYANGSLVFHAFRAEEYRQDVHAALYQCVATSSLGVVRSRPVHVRAVVQQYYEVQVYDEFVIVDNTAVLKCNIPTFVKDYVNVAEWIKSENTIVHADNTNKAGNRYIFTSSGDLYINQVESSDSFETYRCKTVHRLSGEQRLSSPARIIVSDPKSSVPPRITHSVPAVQVQQRQSVQLPCAAQGQPTPTFRWVKEEGNEIRPVQPSSKIKQVNGILSMEDVQMSDSGIYLCIATNNIGEEKSETVLRVTAPLTARIEPSAVSLDVGKPATLNCVVSGYPVVSVSWTKDGQPLRVDDRIRLLTKYILRIEAVQREDRGMYQCFARNNDEIAQGIAELSLGDVGPMLHTMFESKLLQPGVALSLQCSASGNPTPVIEWLLDGRPLATVGSGSGQAKVVDGIEADGTRRSTLNVTATSARDAGEYRCVATNRAGDLFHAARIDIYGPPFIRPMPDVTAVAGTNLYLQCRVGGYPISSTSWEKDGNGLPVDRRQIVYPNGTLVIQNVDRTLDGGSYVCVAKNERGETARESVLVKVTVPPVIDSMSFPQVLVLRVGTRARLQCVVAQGDLPLGISWLKDGRLPASDLNVQLRKDDEFSSVLTFPSIATAHNGNYTCFAENSGGTTNLTTMITVEVPPQWVVQPTDASTISGGNVTVDCVADGYPKPEITWKKALGRHTGEYRDATLASFRAKLLPNGSLTITNAVDDDEGQYLCEANNGIATGLSKVVTLKVHASAYFETRYQNQTAKKNDKVTLQCEARGDAPIFISWMKNNIPLTSDGNNRLTKADRSLSHGLLSELTIFKVERQDEGAYYCSTWNSYGRDESAIQLSIKEPPDIPDSVKIGDHGGRAVTITWGHPYNGGSMITGYVVQYKRASEEWATRLPNVTVGGGNTSAMVRGLLPGTPYSFRVLARNVVGVSLPSPGVGITTAEEAPAGPPRELSAKAIGPDALLLTWRAPRLELSNGDILGYYVGYKLFNTSDSYQYVSMETSKGSSADVSLKLTKLKKYMKYVLAVQAYNRMGKGPFSEETVTATDEDVPEKPPENVRCWGISSHSVNASWFPPNKLYQHGVILGYKVHYHPVKEDEDSSSRKSEIKVNRLQATLHGLEKFANYSVRVLGFTRIGDGISSESVYCNTLEDVPGPPEDIKVVIKSATEVVIAWKPPSHPNGEILKYTVYMRQPQDRKQATKRFAVDSVRPTMDISGLKENQRYEFWVTASTVVGEGQSTRVASQTPRQQVKANVAAFPTRVVRHWNADVVLLCPAVGIPPPQREWFKGTKRLSSGSVTLTVDGSLVLKQVQRSDSGNYSCQVENAHGKDQVDHQILVQAPPDPPLAVISKTTVSSVQLGWKSSDDGGSPIKGFYLRYKKEFGEWEEVKLEHDQLSHTLNNLQCGTKYQITMSAFNKIGPGHQSDVIVASTNGSAPGTPIAHDVLFPNVSYAMLRLANWPTGGCPIHYFVLQYKQAFQREWGLISNNVQRQHEFVTISDLKPGEKYELLVIAHSDAGSTKAKYDFTTFTALNSDRAFSDAEESAPFYMDITIIIPLVSSAITLSIILVGGCIILRRRRYAGYRHTKNGGHPDLTPDTDSSGDKKRDHHTKRAPPYDQEVVIKRNNNCNAIENCVDEKGAEDICPYATSNLPGCTEEERAYSLQLKTFGHLDYGQRHDFKPPPYPGKSNVYSSAVITRSNTDGRKSRGVVLRPQHYPSVEEMYPSLTAPHEYPLDLSPNSSRQRTQLFLLLDKKCGSDWDIRQASRFLYDTEMSPKSSDQVQVPDLIYRGADSSTPNDSSPDEIRNGIHSDDFDPHTLEDHSIYPLTVLNSVMANGAAHRYEGSTGASRNSPGNIVFR